ncbi:MAG: acetyl-CoA hydrolase [Burkholderiaceae bacterium]|nr:acetyl-CoA hydrolase [Burkholderiaceae bacterium]
MTVELHPHALDLARIVRPGDRVFWGQGSSEPLTLSEALVRQRHDIGEIGVFLGVSFSDTLAPEHADKLSFVSYGAMGTNQRLARAGVLDVLPCHYSRIPDLLARGALRCDVAMIQLSAPDDAGRYSLGVANDYMLDAARVARVVIAEVNDRAPWTHGAALLGETRIDYLVRTSRELPRPTPHEIGETERAIGAHAAPYVPLGAVLETGIGAIPDAILASLRGHRDLGVHTGILGDGVVELIEAGVVNNRLKPIDRGVTVSGLLSGSEGLYRYADRNPAIRLSPARYTHSAAVMARFDCLVAINSALEVDLSGQVNAEASESAYLGAVGGQGDFVRAALASARGRSIIALPSSARGETISRIVSRLSGGVATTPRSDADLVVTEWGVAELRGCTIGERAERMIAIAHPAFREQLERDSYELTGRRVASRAPRVGD